MNLRISRRSYVITCCVVAFGCDARNDVPGARTTRDSAGILIVETAAVTDSTTWTIDFVPILSIGTLDGPEHSRFFSIRETLRLADGRIVVADGTELRFFDPSGSHIHSVGRSGGGPGEYQGINLLTRFGEDSLLVWDFGLHRATILSRDGQLGRTVLGPDLPGFFIVLGAFGDGSLVAAFDAAINPESAVAGLQRGASTYVRFDPTTTALDTIGSFPAGQYFVRVGDRFNISVLPFAYSGIKAFAGDRLYYGDSESLEIRTHSKNGTLQQVVRYEMLNAPLTDEIIDAYIEARTARAQDDNARRQMASDLRGLPYNETLPAFSEIIVDADANVWVKHYAVPGSTDSRWTVLDSAGVWMANLTMPPRFTPREIGSDYLLGMYRDSLDVQYVHLLPIDKETLAAVSL